VFKRSGGESDGDRLDRLSLLVGHLVGDPQAYGDQEIASFLGGADAAASNSQRATVRSARGHPDPDRRPVEGGDVDLGPQHSLGPADLGVEGQVQATSTKDRMRGYPDYGIKVAGRPAVVPGGTQARQPDPLPIANARRHPHPDGARPIGPVNAELGRQAAYRILEFQVQDRFQVLASPSGRARPPATSEEAAQEADRCDCE